MIDLIYKKYPEHIFWKRSVNGGNSEVVHWDVSCSSTMDRVLPPKLPATAQSPADTVVCSESHNQ